MLMACDVPSITLAELFYHYSDEHTYDTLLKVWLEGRIVSRGRKNRGRSSTAPKKNKNKRRKRTPRQLVAPQAACAETGRRVRMHGFVPVRKRRERGRMREFIELLSDFT